MRRPHYLLPLALLCALLVALTATPITTVWAGIIPPLVPTATATATATSAPTSTPRPSATAIPTATSTPSPTPGVQQVGGGGTGTGTGTGTSDTTCGADALHIPVPFSSGYCVSWFDVLSQLVGAVWHGIASALQHAVTDLAAALLGPLSHTDDPTANGDLTAISGTLTTDALSAYVAVFLIAAVWVARPGLFGTMSEGLSLLYRAALVMGALKSYDTLVRLWVGLCNGLAGDIGQASVTNFGHGVAALALAPFLLLLAGLERAVADHVFAFAYMVGPLAIVMAVWPPTMGIAVAWAKTFAYLGLLGAGYALMTHAIVATTNARGGIWGTVLLLAGLLTLALVPAIVAALLNATAHTIGKSFAGIAATAAGV